MIFALLNKLVSYSGVQYKSIGKRKGKALFHYVVPPPGAPRYYYQISHSNKLASHLMIGALRRLGYDVHNTFYMSPAESKNKYDLVIGHGPGFANLCNNHPRARKVLLLTGSDPYFGNQAQRERAKAFEARHGFWIPPYSENLVPSHENNLRVADAALIMGNDFVRKTYAEEFQKKMILIRNVTPFIPSIQTSDSANSFLFMSSVGQIHRGLDLVLDSFSTTGFNLDVCSDYLREPDFYSFYRSAFNRANIQGRGFVRTTEQKLSKLASKAAFSILPSCSEGLSSSLINMITKGLTPVYTPACGLPFDDIGVCLKDVTVPAISHAACTMMGWSNKERLQRSKETMERSLIFQPNAFKTHFSDVLRDIL